MKFSVEWTWNPETKRVLNAKEGFLDARKLRRVQRFHRTIPGYEPTPLWELRGLASELGLGRILVKDESQRFGLNAFKVLGASYAVSRALSERLGASGKSLPLFMLRERLGLQSSKPTLVTATDGNHGRAVAWTARQLGIPAQIYLPRGTTQSRIDNIQAEGAVTVIVEGNYDLTVQEACSGAELNSDWLLVQDTAWPGYDSIPRWIMQGYSTLIAEIMDQVAAMGTGFTHLLLQCGVGSFAGSIQGYLASLDGVQPKSVVLEPQGAPCLLRSLEAQDRQPQEVLGDLDTIMAGLACGRPNPIAWEILANHADCFAACDDRLAALGMRVLGNPLAGDPRIVSGESGSVGLGFLYEIMKSSEYERLRERLQLDANARVLIISTEGNTDASVYRSIVWNGDYCYQSRVPGLQVRESTQILPSLYA